MNSEGETIAGPSDGREEVLRAAWQALADRERRALPLPALVLRLETVLDADALPAAEAAHYRRYWWQLEQVNAVLLDADRQQTTAEETALVEAALHGMRTLLASAMHRGRPPTADDEGGRSRARRHRRGE